MIELGRLERLDLRTAWLSEPHGFTPWLPRPDNLALLGETLGIELELEALERDVGPFRADILCKDINSDTWVLIENQLERTDHLHLGQLVTYAAGLDAVAIVWIAANFTEEHRAALDWLNRITTQTFRFFGLEVELWRIGSSVPAPKFNLVAKPNDWSQSVGRAARTLDGLAAQREEAYARYWASFREFLDRRSSSIRITVECRDYAIRFRLGRSGFWLEAEAGRRDKYIGAWLLIRDLPGKPMFRALAAERQAIETQLGFAVEWMELPEQRRSRIGIKRREVDPSREQDWLSQHTWLAEKLEMLDQVFRSKIALLGPATRDLTQADLDELTPEPP